MVERSVAASLLRSLGACLVLAGLNCLLLQDAVSAQDRQIRRAASGSESVGAETRTALVIGNGAYSADPLANPVNDVKAMAAILRTLGFNVTEKTNATEKEMLRAINEFGDKLKGGGVGLFYYSGHGAQVNGENYMVPIGSNIRLERDLEIEGVKLARVLNQMEDAENGLNIVILDACRNNPYGRSIKSSTRGLAPVTASGGTFIAYATSPGTVATDGPGMKNSPYTAELVKYLPTPGLKLLEVFNRVNEAVQQSTGKRQIPWVSFSVVPDFYFAGGYAIIERQEPEPAPLKTGTLKIESKPSGAAVYVDEAAKGKTPATVTALSSGEVNVRVVLEGYKPQEKTIEIRQGKEVQATFLLDPEEKRAEQKVGQTWREPITGMEFVWVPGGCYQMGCSGLTCSGPEKPLHKVCIDGFWIGKTEVTQGQWQKMMGNNPSSFKSGEDHPVEMVSWDDAKELIRKLNEKSITGESFRLPTEAEWEYACRSGGRDEEYAGDSDVGAVAWYWVNSGKKTHPVGNKQPNGLGLFDMSGNVWEWCEDIYSDKAYSKHQSRNPVNADKDYGGAHRVIRGGSWDNDSPFIVRCGFRHDAGPANRNADVGLRLVRIP